MAETVVDLAAEPMDMHVDDVAVRLAVRGKSVQFLGLAEPAPIGGVLLIAQDLTDSKEFDELLLNSFFWGGLVTVVLALAGATVVGSDAVRQIEAVTRATEQIVGGDLSRRLPTRGRVGDLDRLAGVINAMLSEIEQLMLEVTSAGENIAHDLRTPLTAGSWRACGGGFPARHDRRRVTAPGRHTEL